MLAIHQGAKTEYRVLVILGGKVVIRNTKNNVVRRITSEQFEDNYFIYREEGTGQSELELVPTLEQEKSLISLMADEIVWEEKWSRINQDETFNPKPKKVKKKKKIKEESKENGSEGVIIKKEQVKTDKERKGKKGSKATKGKLEESNTSKTISLKEICVDLGIDPAKARRLLRKTDLVQAGRWEWDNPQVIEKVRNLLKS